MNNRPNPLRFENFTELPDESGFTLPNCDFVFKYDQYNGWYDEYGFYYNSNGQPAEDPNNYADDYYDYDDQYNCSIFRIIIFIKAMMDIQKMKLMLNLIQAMIMIIKLIKKKIETLHSIIDQYGQGQEIQIYLTNLNFKLHSEQIANYFLQDFKGQMNPKFYIKQGQKKGSAYIHTTDKLFAKHCAQKAQSVYQKYLQIFSQYLMERKIYMEIEPLDNYDDNIQQAEIISKQEEKKIQEQKQNEEKKIQEQKKVPNVQTEQKKIEPNENKKNNPAPQKTEEKKIEEPKKVSNIETEEKKIEPQKQGSSNEDKKNDSAPQKTEEKKIEQPPAQKDEDDDNSWGKITKGNRRVVAKVVTKQPQKQQQSQQQQIAAQPKDQKNVQEKKNTKPQEKKVYVPKK